MTAISSEHMTPGQQELEANLRSLLVKYAFRGLAIGFLTFVTILIWGVRLEGKTEQNSARIEEVRREGSQPVQDLKRDIAVLQEAMRSLTAELQRTQATIRGNR